jgi:serine/threonine-protein kinase
MIAKVPIQHRCDWCNRDSLQDLLGDALPAEERDRWEEHLSSCRLCRTELEMLASPPECWTETREAIASGMTAIQCDPPPAQTEETTHRMLLAWLEPIAADQPSNATCQDQGVGTPSKWLGKIGNYFVHRVLGYGGMGVVLECFDPVLGRIVAIKAMHPHLAAIGTARQRFIREARAAAAIVHPNVVPIHGVDAEHQPPFLIMQRVQGETLQSRVERDGPLSVEVALRVAYQIAGGLAAAHAQGLAHRDVKPANILLESGTERAMLTDFGVARALDDATVTASGSIAGTPEYMSPEQARGESIDARSDQFSFGSVLYFMLTGRTPFRGDGSMAILRRVQAAKARTMLDIDPRLPVWTQGLIDRLHSRRPENRFRDAGELASWLRQCLAHCHDPRRHRLPRGLVGNVLRQTLVTKSMVAWTVLSVASIPAALWLSPPRQINQQVTDPAAVEHQAQGDLITPSEWSQQWDPWGSHVESIREQLNRLGLEESDSW